MCRCDDDRGNGCFEGVNWEMKLRSRDLPSKYSTARSDDGCFSDLNNYYSQQHIFIGSTTTTFPPFPPSN